MGQTSVGSNVDPTLYSFVGSGRTKGPLLAEPLGPVGLPHFIIGKTSTVKRT